MTKEEVRARLLARLDHAGATAEPSTLDALEAYFQLLARWNPKINLTALPLNPPLDETFDRLFVEPIAAAKRLDLIPNPRTGAMSWLDLGSGGGSPAIPLKIVRPSWTLTMVEAKERKAAFLREAVRALRLPEAEVVNARFEEIESSGIGADLITIRAVKLDEQVAHTLFTLLGPAGWVAVFSSSDVTLPGFEVVGSIRLIPASSATLMLFRVPRGTQTR